MRSTIEVLCGPIACGKSTYAAKRAEQGWMVVNDDAITTMLHGGTYDFREEHRDTYFQMMLVAIDYLILRGHNVVVDTTAHTKSIRQRIVTVAKMNDVNLVGIAWPWPWPTVSAVKRIESDSRGLPDSVWHEVARTHYNDYDGMTTDEGFDKIRVIIDTRYPVEPD